MAVWVFFPVSSRPRLSLLIIIMSNERQPKTNRLCNICNIAGTFFSKGKLSSILQLSRALAPTPSSIEKVASFDNPTRWVTKILFSDIFIEAVSYLLVFPHPPVNTPVVGINHVPIAASATDSVAYTLSPISALVSGLETSPSVSDHAVLTIVVANYW